MSSEVPPTDAVQLWLAWKHANEHLQSAVINDVGKHSELAEPERTVLIYLHAAGGSLRQSALTAATGWDRGRLSHLLTRMETQQLVQRTRLKNGVDISITTAGETAWTAAEASLRAALEHHMIKRLTPEQLAHLVTVLAALGEMKDKSTSTSKPAVIVERGRDDDIDVLKRSDIRQMPPRGM